MNKNILLFSFLFLMSLQPILPDSLEQKLLSAVQNHKFVRVKLVVARGADINVMGHEGLTPLMLAVQGEYLTIVRYLLAQGADPDILNHEGRTAMEMALDQKNTVLVHLISQRKAINELKVRTNTMRSFEVSGSENDSVYDISYQNNTFKCRFMSTSFFGIVKTKLKLTVNSIPNEGMVTTTGLHLGTTELKVHLNDQLLGGSIVSGYFLNNGEYLKKYTMDINVGGEVFKGEVIRYTLNEVRGELFYDFKINLGGNTITGVRYLDNNEIYYDLQINQEPLRGKRNARNQYSISTEMKVSYFYLFMMLEIYFDYLDYNKDNN